MKFSLYNISVYNIVLYVFISLNPFIRWIVYNEIFYLYFLVTTLSITYICYSRKSYLNFNNNRFAVFFILVVYVSYITLPLIDPHVLRTGHLAWFFPLLLIVFYSKEVLVDAFQKLKIIIAYLSMFAIGVWIVNLIGVNLPYFELDRGVTNQVYRVYGLSVAQYRFGIPLQTGIGGIERLCGPFAEPGHFGIIVGLILYICRLNLQSLSNKIILFAGILTFSPAFIFILLVTYIRKLLHDKTLSKSSVIVFTTLASTVVIALTDTYLGNQIRYVAYERTFGEIETNPLDDRIQKSFLIEYAVFLTSGNFLVGMGFESIQEIDTPSNYRSYVYTYGLLGVMIFITLILVIISKLEITDKMALLAILLMIFLHRYWFFLYPSIYALLIVGLDNLLYSEKRPKYKCFEIEKK